LSRDLTIGAMAANTARHRDWEAFGRLTPSVFGKIATAGQYVVMMAVLLWPTGLELALVLSITLCFLAAGEYLTRYLRSLREQTEDVVESASGS
jgi:hypothetical protein